MYFSALYSWSIQLSIFSFWTSAAAITISLEIRFRAKKCRTAFESQISSIVIDENSLLYGNYFMYVQRSDVAGSSHTVRSPPGEWRWTKRHLADCYYYFAILVSCSAATGSTTWSVERAAALDRFTNVDVFLIDANTRLDFYFDRYNMTNWQTIGIWLFTFGYIFCVRTL